MFNVLLISSKGNADFQPAKADPPLLSNAAKG
jgi:hypothetical protein